MPDNKKAAPVVAHRNGQNSKPNTKCPAAAILSWAAAGRKRKDKSMKANEYKQAVMAANSYQAARRLVVDAMGDDEVSSQEWDALADLLDRFPANWGKGAPA